MANEMFDGPQPFNKDDLDYVVTNLSDEVVKPEDVLQDVLEDVDPSFVEKYRRSFMGWLGRLPNTDILWAGDDDMGDRIASAIWKISKDKIMINNFSPNFIFLTVPDPVMDPPEGWENAYRNAWRSILCTLISEISSYVVNVPSKEMMESGILGGQFAQKYIERENEGVDDDQGSDGKETDCVDSLIELFLALQHCDFVTGEDEETSTGIKHVDYVPIVVLDRFERFCNCDEDDVSDRFDRFLMALHYTVVVKMKGHIWFVQEISWVPP
ncbi:hypothetical protein F5Y12DRAFT_739179, partial [Xylaria sp. FL1777]